MVDAADSKSAGAIHAGSSPASGTTEFSTTYSSFLELFFRGHAEGFQNGFQNHVSFLFRSWADLDSFLRFARLR